MNETSSEELVAAAKSLESAWEQRWTDLAPDKPDFWPRWEQLIVEDMALFGPHLWSSDFETATWDLMIVLNALKKIPGLQGQLDHLELLHRELSAIYQGSKSNFFDVPRRPGRARMTTAKASEAALAAAAVECLRPFERSLKSTCAQVAPIFASAGVTNWQGKPVSPATVVDWHSQATAGEETNPIRIIFEKRAMPGIPEIKSRSDAMARVRSTAMFAVRLHRKPVSD